MLKSFILIFLLPALPALSQGNDSLYRIFTHSITLELSQPLGEFNETHSFGIGFRYLNDGYRARKIKAGTSKQWSFVFGGGLGWHPGRKEAVNAFEFEYHNLFYGYVSGGAKCQVNANWEFNMGIGPALRKYASTTRFNIYTGLQTSYMITPRLGARGGLHLLKEKNAATSAMAALGLAWFF